MSETKLRLFNRVRTLSSAAVAIATVLSLLFSQWLGTNSLGWQLVLATIALAIGIPHGALDHLVTIPKAAPIRMALFIILYVAIALLAIYAILRWNVWGFIFVVIMSATHFGIGDAAFLSEIHSMAAPESQLGSMPQQQACFQLQFRWLTAAVLMRWKKLILR